MVKVFLIYFILFLIFFANGENKFAPNGCGSSNFVINNGLKEVGEGNLIDCCNKHDDCYLYCLGKRYCDKKFYDCLVNTCSNLPFIRRQLCLMDVEGMYAAVNLLGSTFYCAQNNLHPTSEMNTPETTQTETTTSETILSETTALETRTSV